MKYTYEEGQFAKQAYEGRLAVIGQRIQSREEAITQFEKELEELNEEHDRLISEHNKIVENTESQVKTENLEKSFSELIEIWQKQPEANKDKFFDKVFFGEFFNL